MAVQFPLMCLEAVRHMSFVPHKTRQGRTHLFLLAIGAAPSVGTERCLVPVIAHEHDVSRFIMQHFDCCRTKPVCKMFFLTDFLMCSYDHYLGLKWFCFVIWLNSISASGLFVFLRKVEELLLGKLSIGRVFSHLCSFFSSPHKWFFSYRS